MALGTARVSRTFKLYSLERGSTKLHQILGEQSSIIATPNRILWFRCVSSFRTKGGTLFDPYKIRDGSGEISQGTVQVFSTTERVAYI